VTPEPVERIEDLEAPIDHYQVASVLQGALRFNPADKVALFGIHRGQPQASGFQVISVRQIEGIEQGFRAYAQGPKAAVSIEEFVDHLIHVSDIKPKRDLIGIALRFASTTIPVQLRPLSRKKVPPPETTITLDNAVYGHPDSTKTTDAWAYCIDGMSHHVSWSDPEELARRPRWDVVPPLGFTKGQLMLRKELHDLLHLHAGVPSSDQIEE
jgi:hypothetical protein